MATTTGGSLGGLRAANRAALLQAIEASGAMSRAELARFCGLSSTTVSSLVQELLTDRVLVERTDRGTPHRGRSGRPPILLELAEPRGAVLAIDVGHSHLRVALARPDATILSEEQQPFDADDNPAETLDLIAELAGAALAAYDVPQDEVRAVGLGIPGPVDRQGTMISSILPRWRGLRPAEEFHQRTGLLPRVDNDAHMGALGELAFGAARGLDHVIYVKAATGVGAGIVIDGRIVRGGAGIAGELGHVNIDANGAICRCGSRGCLETIVSAPKLVELLQPAHDAPLSVNDLLRLAHQGDPGAVRAIADSGRVIGRVLADLCNVLNPERIVAGGTLGTVPAFTEGIRASIDRHAQPPTAAAVDVVPGELGERAEVMGALATALAEEPVA